jgi:DNA-binding beta-propeller fold protein YncE
MSPLSAYAQPNSEGFMPGHIYNAELGDFGCFHGDNTWIREIDPFTGESWILADMDDGMCDPGGLRFTPGGRLRVLNFTSNNVMDIDSAGNTTLIYETNDGLNGPGGENGAAFDADGSFYVANEFGSRRLLKFPNDTAPPIIFADRDDGLHGSSGLEFASNGELFVATRDDDVLRFTPDGVPTLFDSFDGNPSPMTLDFDRAGNFFLGVETSGPDDSIYRYDGGLLENKRLLANDLDTGTFTLRVSPDQRELYVAAATSLFAIDVQDGAQRLVFNYGPDITGGVGMMVYIPPVPGDLNDDDVVNLVDYQLFLTCTAGPDNPVAPLGCSRRRFLHADMEFDNDVDFADFAILQHAMSGP